MFRGYAPPFHSGVYVSGHSANIVSRGSVPPEQVQKNILSWIFLYIRFIIENNRLNDPGFGYIRFYVFLGYQIQMPGRNII